MDEKKQAFPVGYFFEVEELEGQSLEDMGEGDVQTNNVCSNESCGRDVNHLCLNTSCDEI